jgi:nucleoside-diphosphate-sugar epimerase/acyl carrier protein
LRHPHERDADTEFLLGTLARLWLSGVHVNWSELHTHEHCHRIHLPVYPFERQRYWAQPSDPGEPVSPIIYKEPDIADWFYIPTWEYAILSESNQSIGKMSCWLVFEDDCGVGRCMVNQLEQEGHDVIAVQSGKDYAKTGPQTYTIDPSQRQHYITLFAELRDMKRLPEKIVHLWSVGPTRADTSELERFEYYQDLGFYSLLNIAQALIKLRINDPVQIAVVSNDVHLVTGEEQICPAKATLLGACKAIPQEYPNIICRNIDIVVQVPYSRTSESVARELVAELSQDDMYPTVAYRAGQRWLQRFEPLILEESPETIPMLRHAGVYLITGGLGDIGLTLAEYLARALQARLVLLGRSYIPMKQDWGEWLTAHDPEDETSVKIQRLQYIESLGAEVLTIAADVADASQMRMALEQADARFGSLHGVIHAAGNVSANAFFSIDQADPDLCEQQFKAKVRGLIVLEEVLRNKNLDFVVLLSSISTVLAGLGYVAYSAANLYMDAFAHKSNQTSDIPWTSIDWDTWEFQDTWSDEANPTSLSMYPEEGVEAFWRILSYAMLPQVVVSTGYLQDRIDQWIHLQFLREAKEMRDRQSDRFYSRPEMEIAYIAPRNSVEQTIAEIWQETLGIAQVGVNDHFFNDLNGSSLLATQLLSTLRDRFQVEIPLRRIFEGPTVAELAVMINSQSEGELSIPPMA